MTHRSPSRFVLGATAVCLALALQAPVRGQVPEKFTNLKVLPKKIAKDDLSTLMRNFCFALDVKCNHCHVGPDDIQGMDFASDEKPSKRTAREMIKMMDEINGRLLRKIDTGRETRVGVECQTCHHRLLVPETMVGIMTRLVASEGVEAALAKYRELREQYYGKGVYDFSSLALNRLADDLRYAGETDAALAVLHETLERFPESTWALGLLGSTHRDRGEIDEAVAAYKKMLEINPNSGWAKQALEQLAERDKPQDKPDE